tara:strand:+ start:5 stop:475 length:471 start_codon:yes stop_codon:yes gene_type:complete
MNFGPTTTNPMDRRGRPTFEEQYDQMIRNKEMKEKGKEMIGKGVRMAGDALRSAFGGGAITGDSADRREPTEQIMVGNPMASPTAADNVRMPQDLQAGYMHMNRFGSPLPIHGLGTPARTAIANNIQDQNFMAYHNAIIGARNPMGMSRVPFGGMN